MCTYILGCICSEYVSVVSLCVSVASFGGYSCVSVIMCLSVCMCGVFVCLSLCTCVLPESGCLVHKCLPGGCLSGSVGESLPGVSRAGASFLGQAGLLPSRVSWLLRDWAL